MFTKQSKYYRYSLGIEVTKGFAKFIFFLSPVVLILFIVFRDKYNFSPIDFQRAILGAIFGCLFSLYYAGTWCDIKVDENGLYVEFLWNMLFVPWKEIKQLKYLGFYPIGYWVVHAQNSLTLFHRLYSLGTFPPSLSFHIHDSIDNKNELISIIKKKASLNIMPSPKL
jgi:hypothetical protein